ncbi:short chain aldehyde dehydrogenase 1 [Ricinus communis]|uniref:Short chain alcohol dehydrogenase, putative n=1 Tax=Ricinus communis TaxID=3988 RepID=B9RHX5_RICCO|nr:short chain aldehyde dehydrogenase 1 [Ricinus communis]EEF48747.1 short chain alcohol dehydrogenase, putative [Ricinus communis]|eukprot:XP_002513344.1 secoisolariciresinol dehydrogenase [Ricinus communis]
MSGHSAETSTPKRLEGKVALITGGASGLGATSAKLFVEHGAKVLIADIQDEIGSSLCKQIGSQDIISYVHCDVTCDSDVRNAVDLAVSKYGKLDIMFNNAGVAGKLDTRILATENEEFKRVFKINMFGAYLGAKHAARVMIPAKKGCILFTSSNGASTCLQSPHPYVVSKHALNGFAKNLCVELGQYGIRVNCISPFLVATPLVAKNFGKVEVDDLTMKTVQDLVSTAGNLKAAILEPEDIANAALYLASDDSKYVSGMNLVVDGGYSICNPSIAMSLQNLSS